MKDRHILLKLVQENFSYDLFLCFLKMHVVSYSSLYSNIREAMPNIRGLAVVGLFFEVKFSFYFVIKTRFF
jgi:hypothetical protein